MKRRRRSTQYSRQIGEAAVCAELGRHGYLAAAFAGNVPAFDVICVDAELRAIPIQVKTFQHARDNHPCWPLTGRFLDITVSPRTGRQTVRPRRLGPIARLVHVFVLLRSLENPVTKDRFFVCTGRDVLRACLKHYGEFLKRNRGRRPRNPNSTEMRLRPQDLRDYEGRWDLLNTRLRERG